MNKTEKQYKKYMENMFPVNENYNQVMKKIDFNKIMNSITEKLMVLPNDTIVYSGHGDITMIGDEKNIYLELKPKDF